MSRIHLLSFRAYDQCMSIELIIAAILGVFLLFYLVYSIVRPDRF